MGYTRQILITAILSGVLAGALPRMAPAASFDCDRSGLAADEKAICDNRTLNDADVKMVTTFDILTGLVAMGNRDKMKDEQSTWLKKRQACAADAECIAAAYAERLKQLDEGFKAINRPL